MKVAVISCYPEEFEDKLNKKINEIKDFPKDPKKPRQHGHVIDIKFSIDGSLSHSKVIALILWDGKEDI